LLTMSCTGKIKTYSRGKGQGWIKPDVASNYDVYCHVIENAALAWIQEGDSVKYDYKVDLRPGNYDYATNIEKIEPVT